MNKPKHYWSDDRPDESVLGVTCLFPEYKGAPQHCMWDCKNCEFWKEIKDIVVPKFVDGLMRYKQGGNND